MKINFNTSQIITGVVVALIVGSIGWFATYWMQIPLLRTQVDDLRASQSKLIGQLNELQQNYIRMEGFLEAKLNYNYSAFVAISNQKKIPQSEFKAVLPMLENKPEEAASYLKNTLNFTPVEVKAVFTVPKKIIN